MTTVCDVMNGKIVFVGQVRQSRQQRTDGDGAELPGNTDMNGVHQRYGGNHLSKPVDTSPFSCGRSAPESVLPESAAALLVAPFLTANWSTLRFTAPLMLWLFPILQLRSDL